MLLVEYNSCMVFFLFFPLSPRVYMLQKKLDKTLIHWELKLDQALAVF